MHDTGPSFRVLNRGHTRTHTHAHARTHTRTHTHTHTGSLRGVGHRGGGQALAGPRQAAAPRPRRPHDTPRFKPPPPLTRRPRAGPAPALLRGCCKAGWSCATGALLAPSRPSRLEGDENVSPRGAREGTGGRGGERRHEREASDVWPRSEARGSGRSALRGHFGPLCAVTRVAVAVAVFATSGAEAKPAPPPLASLRGGSL